MKPLRLLVPVLALVSASCAAPPRGAEAPSSAPVELTLHAIDGTAYSLEAQRGKVVVVDVWATWCGPCIRSLPALESLAAARPDEILVVGLSVDHDKKALTDFLAERRPSYFVAHADAAASRVFRANVLPTVFVLDREGVIRETLIGSHPAATLIETAKSYL